MKWYKKQMDKLKASEPPKPDKKAVSKKTSGQSFDAKKMWAKKHTFPNPVAARNRNRPKTDAI